MSPLHILSDPETIVVFTYAPAGLGHLRVTNSLYAGLPKGVKTVLIGSSDKSIEAIHKFISIHIVTRRLMEWFQRGRPQKIFTILYRSFLRSDTSELYFKLTEIFEQQVDLPKRMIIVATHFGLAHKIAQIKNDLESKTGVKIYLIVQITDDTPQYIWYVPGADMIFVPSRKVMLELKEYAIHSGLPKVKMEILPYPVSPVLAKKMDEKQFKSRKKQLSSDSREKIHFSLPVPGAAVGMEFLEHIIPQLQSRNSNFLFHVVCKEAPFTQKFLKEVRSYPNVYLHTSKHDRELVDVYDRIYQDNVISLETTKPSEQAFKALYDFDMIGGSLLLFSNPVGKQESDNIDFLIRHNLIFDRNTTNKLWDYAETGMGLSGAQKEKIFSSGKNIRGIQLPFGSKKSAIFITWCLDNGIFERMVNYPPRINNDFETQPNGVELFWNKVSSLV